MSELTIQRRRSGAISGSERITGVKNAQADMLLLRKKQQYEFLLRKKEQDIQLEEHKLENENKLLNLENKKNELEYKRRLYPGADLSNDEMTVTNLEKYLVRNSNKLCYTDKSLENKVRNRCSTDMVPPIVAEARTTIVKKEIMRAVEKNRKHMYNFLEKPVSRQDKRVHHPEQQLDKIDEFETFIKENTLPSFSGHLMPDQPGKPTDIQQPTTKSQHFLVLPKVPEQPILKTPSREKKSPAVIRVKVPVDQLAKHDLHRKLKQNPVVREAVEMHHKEKSLHDQKQSSQSAAGVLSRMSKKKPPTKTQIKEELENVQCQVGDFCERIEKILWDYKEEQFRQDIKFVKDKDAEWNRFMETMKKRTRKNNSDQTDGETFTPEVPMSRRPKTANITDTPVYSERQREQRLMKNLLVTKPRLVESAPTRKRGVPHHTEERSHHHSPRAKLQRMLERNKNILDAVIKAGQEKQETPGAASLTVAAKQAQIGAK